MYDTIIVGGGASGTMCAIVASQRGLKTLIIDKGVTPAKKLMVTGNGKCNLTNTNMSSKFYNVNIDKYLSRFGVENTLIFFKQLGLITHTDEMGRVYPYSNSARSVIDIINAKLEANNVNIVANEKVIKVYKKSSGWHVVTENNEYLTKSIVLSCGSEYLECGEKQNKLYPSLCALKTKETTKKLSGIRLSDVVVKAVCGKNSMIDKGEVLFKDEGLSGIVVFNLSCLFARSKSFCGKVSIDLMPDYSCEDVEKILLDRINNFGQNCFKGLFVDEVANLVCKKAGVQSIAKSNANKLAYVVKDLTFDIVGCYENNQVFSGGIDLYDLDENLQSKKQKGLYVIGEFCDVDGECGGYNLQWAWTSGYIVGSSI